MSRLSMLLVALAIVAVGCLIDDLTLDGKQCPCTSGFVCDESQNLCVAGDSTTTGVGAGSGAGAGGAGGSGASTGVGASSTGACNDDPMAAVQVSNLRAEWTTPNVVQWRWDRGMGDIPDQLARFELVIGDSEADVTSRSGSAVVVTAMENPELGRYYLPHTGGDEPVEKTMTDGLLPDTVYFAQLIAVDTGSRTSCSNIAQGRTTLPPTGAIEIFSENPTSGYSLPNNFTHTMGNAYMGDFCYEYVNMVCNPTEACWENLRRQDLGIDLSNVGLGAFQTSAYFEFAVSHDSTFPVYWGQIWLMLPDNSLAMFSALTIRSGGYRLYQIPLRALQRNGTALNHGDLASGLKGFNVGGGWEGGATVRLDELRIRW